MLLKAVAMRKNCALWLDTVRNFEGGYVNDPQDPGGATKYGISTPTLSAHLGRPATPDDVRNLSSETANSILLTNYWNKIRGDDLPGGLDLALGDAVVMSNMGTMVRLLQGILGVEQDGFVGPRTIEAARKADTAATVRRLFDARLDYLRTLPTWSRFGLGWGNRCMDLEGDCLALVESNATEARALPAAAETSLLALLALALGQAQALAPDLVEKLTGAQQAATAHDWATFASLALGALAIAVPAGIRFYLRVRAYVHGKTA